jgi:hypothetical protein
LRRLVLQFDRWRAAQGDRAYRLAKSCLTRAGTPRCGRGPFGGCRRTADNLKELVRSMENSRTCKAPNTSR